MLSNFKMPYRAKQFHYFIIFFFLLSALPFNSWAQLLGKFEDPKPKKTSPEIGTLGTFNGDDKVDLYTGKVNVNIPLYTIETKDIKLPISLIYNQDGIKVGTKASSVGLGFYLNAASYIQRERKGYPDESGSGRFQTIGSFFPLEIGNTPNTIINKFRNRPYVHNPLLYPNNSHTALWAEFDALELLINGYNSFGNVGMSNNYQVDSEPDLFSFNFLGETGTFVLDENGDPQITEGDTKIKITPPIGPKGYQNFWNVILPSGIQLKFPNNLEYIEKEEYKYLTEIVYPGFYDAPNSVPPNISETYQTFGQYTYLWWVSEITSPSNQAISFQYQSTDNVVDTIKQSKRIVPHIHQVHEYISGSGYQNEQGWVNPRPPFTTASSFITLDEGGWNFSDWLKAPLIDHVYSYDDYSTVIAPKYIYRIIFPDGEITFNQPPNVFRRDAPKTKYLNDIQIANNVGETIKSITPKYEYLMSNGNNSSDPKDYRLCLKELTVQGLDNVKYKYSFEYDNTYNLPNRNSVQQDFFGYFNNNQTTTSVPTIYKQGRQYVLGDRSVNEAKMQANMLKKIFYPTGGSSEFFYRNNTIEDPINAGYNVGGLRVDMIKDFDGARTISTKYNYAGGASPLLLYNPSLYFVSEKLLSDTYPNHGNRNNMTVNEYHVLEIRNFPFSPILLTKGGYVGYNKVEVLKEGLGKTVYEFTSPTSHPDLLSERIVSPSNQYLLNTTPPDFRHISMDAKRGLLLSMKMYNEDGNLVREESNAYNFNFGNPQKIWGMANAALPFLPEQIQSLGNSIMEKYVHVIDLFYYQPNGTVLTESKTTDYTVQGRLDQKKSFSYNSNKSIKEIETTDSKDNVTSIEYRYAEDVSFGGEDWPYYIYGTMMRKNILKPIEIIASRIKNGNKYVIEAQLNKYGIKYNQQQTNAFIVPNSHYSFVATSPLLKSTFKTFSVYGDENEGEEFEVIEPRMRLDVSFIYNTDANLVSVKDISNRATSYLWSYKKQHPIAEIKNADYTAIENILGAASIELFSNQTNPSKTAIDNFIAPLKAGLPNAQISIYTYKPLLGMTSQTDVKGMTTYYEYDNFQRLKAIKDQNGSVIKSYDYHYKP